MEIELKMLDLNNFVFQMIKNMNGLKYMYKKQIPDLIDYTKHYYYCEATNEEISEKFIESMNNLRLDTF